MSTLVVVLEEEEEWERMEERVLLGGSDRSVVRPITFLTLSYVLLTTLP